MKSKDMLLSYDVMQLIFKDKELVFYLQAQVEMGLEINAQVVMELSRYEVGLIDRKTLFEELEFEAKHQGVM